ncbi:helix-turn-helix domain-containing protein [Larkinella punicea]|uniref:AraC family transcriptional regulator n=1 Tax=Larkinella punicea TaxID=2315727 RepID=A0A368JD78_9BACT|nr:AraC family transcriptional regulator [Larkinella punicea]RCR65619.1 AraC family transcriptional regulator [Larkinella punicea]
MKFERIQPPACLKDYVRYFWILESSDTDRAPKTFLPLADGCPGLLFQEPDRGTFYGPMQQKLPGIFVYGQTVNTIELYSVGNVRMIGVYFRPDALNSIFGLNASEYTDTCLDLNAWAEEQGVSLLEQLVAIRSAVGKIERLSAYLVDQIKRNTARPDALIPYAVARIIQSKGTVSLKELQKTAHLSERSFERKFNQRVGISPKVFSRICRFQASLSQFRADDFNRLSDIAFDNLYADQSHFIRSFKEFSGFAPNQFQKRSLELVENFPQLIH